MLHKNCSFFQLGKSPADLVGLFLLSKAPKRAMLKACLLYTSDAADERSSVDLGGRRIIKKKKLAVTHVRTSHLST